MLSTRDICRTPRTALQPEAPPREVQVPMDGQDSMGLITLSGDDTRQAVFSTIHNVWFVNNWTNPSAPLGPAWRNAAGQWVTGAWREWLAARARVPAWAQYTTVRLPALPVPVPRSRAMPLAKQIHYIWVGNHALSNVRVERIAANCRHSSDYVSTLHVDIPAPQILQQVRDQFRAVAPGLQIVPMQGTPFFDAFTASDTFVLFNQVMSGPGQNFSAASDFLRYPLINHYGGIYLDTDDLLLFDINDIDLRAAPNDVLLGPLVRVERLGHFGYNSSIFASHANNPVLSEISGEMHRRCMQSDHFFTKPKPRFDDDGTRLNPSETSMDLVSYGKELFHLVGPGVLNDVLARERPDYYRLLHIAEPGNTLRDTHYLEDREYNQQLQGLIDHYFPFAALAPVAIGAENAWLA